MAKGSENYFKLHIWNILQCVLGLGCFVLEWLAYRASQFSGRANPPDKGDYVTPHYAMPWYLWAGITALVLSVIIPAIIGMIRKHNNPSEKPNAEDKAALLQIKLASGQAILLWNFAARANELVKRLEETWHRWNADGEPLIYPAGGKIEWKNWSDDISPQLAGKRRDFALLYGTHIVDLKHEVPEFSSNTTRHGYPTEREYSEVLSDLREHAIHLNEVAQRVWDSGRTIS
jgi:hypothetical protein